MHLGINLELNEGEMDSLYLTSVCGRAAMGNFPRGMSRIP